MLLVRFRTSHLCVRPDRHESGLRYFANRLGTLDASLAFSDHQRDPAGRSIYPHPPLYRSGAPPA